MHTPNDPICPFAGAIEFYTSLRRMKKKVWLLQYNDGQHFLTGKSADDFTIRMHQFFDHYLKGAPPAIWMTEGVSARLKGIENGLTEDLSGKQP